ncbi:hypothetical protein [Flavobacterium sp. GCM10023249]|uniref:hypothetical protein n=1 Tax=unclassified Flavobacterium TaxID=196869 RepID=UPI00361D24A0
MKNISYLILLFSCLSTAQIDNKKVTFLYFTAGGIKADRIDVRFEVDDDSALVYKNVERIDPHDNDKITRLKENTRFKISSKEYNSLIDELDKAFRLKPKEEEYVCFHSNLLIVNFTRNGKEEELSSECIEANLNSWSLPLLKNFLKLINEKG